MKAATAVQKAARGKAGRLEAEARRSVMKNPVHVPSKAEGPSLDKLLQGR